MNYQHFTRQRDRLEIEQSLPLYDAVLERLQQPSFIIPAALLLFAISYQSLHSSSFSGTRHPGELLWDFAIAVIPAWLLYTLDSWLNPPMFPVATSIRLVQPRTFAAKSELLQRILRMYRPGGGIMSGVASVGRKGLSTLSSSNYITRNTNQPAGLGNYDNSCFQNSILQGLSSLRPLPSYLASALENGVDRNTKDNTCSAGTLRDLIARLMDTDNNGKTLWTPAKLKSLDTWQQQDAQEYFFKLVDEIDKEFATATKALYRPSGLELVADRDDTEDSQHSGDSGYQSISVFSKASSDIKLLRNPLEGLSAQRVACVKCGYSEGLSMIPFNCLTLDLAVGKMQHDLYERLDSYTHIESIEGVECAKCSLLKVQRLLSMIINRGKEAGSSDEMLREPMSRLEAVNLALEEDDFEEKTLAEKCKISAQHRVSSTKTKQVVIARPPRSLAVHINRSVFDERTGNMFKNLAAVRFPSTLDLGPWCLGSAGGSELCLDGELAEDESLRKKRIEEEHWLSDPKTSMIAGEIYPSKITGPIYELRAVITHQGQHENGHYVCYRRHPRPPSTVEDMSPVKSTTSAGGAETKTPDDEKTRVDETSSGTADDEVDQWWRLSDESVWEVTEDQVLAQGGVFMLFYDCVDPNSVLVSETNLDEKDEAEITTLVGSDTAQESCSPNNTEDALDSGEVFHETYDEQTLAKEIPLPIEADEITKERATQTGNSYTDEATQECTMSTKGSSPLNKSDTEAIVEEEGSRPPPPSDGEELEICKTSETSRPEELHDVYHLLLSRPLK